MDFLKEILKSEKFYKIFLAIIFIIAVFSRIVCLIQNNIPYEIMLAMDNKQIMPPAFLYLSRWILVIFHPVADFWKACCLKFIPLFCSIISIPVFYKFSKNILKNNFHILIANFIFTLAPCSILAASQFNQSSMEILVSIILIQILYNMICKGLDKEYYYIILFLLPFFSFSSFFIICTGCILSLIYRREFATKMIISALGGYIYLYFIILQSVFEENINLLSPLHFSGIDKIFYIFGKIFIETNHHLLQKIAGATAFFGYLSFVFSNKTNTKEKILLLSPAACIFIAALAGKYPINTSYFIFLLPISAIILSSINNMFIKTTFLLLFISSLI